MEIVARVRQVKSETKKAMNAPIILMLSKDEQKEIGEMISDLKNVTNATTMNAGKFAVEFV